MTDALPLDSVFLASECGVRGASLPSSTALGPEDVDDRRLSSISAAVDWARTNNLLGIFLDADLLVCSPYVCSLLGLVFDHKSAD